MRWIVAALLVAFALIAMGQDSCSTETGGDESEPKPAKQAKPDRAEIEAAITPAMVVDAAYSPREVREFCRSVKTLGYDDGLSYFKAGFAGGSGGVSAEEAFDELLSRC